MEASLSAAAELGRTTHLRTICEFSLNRPPMRAKVDRQSYDELRPGVDAALALLDWFVELQKTFVAVLNDLGGSQAQPSPATLTILGEALDCCIVLENQFGGWSQCINRFSWFKRTFAQIRRDIAAEVDCDKLNRDLSRFQGFIGDSSYPIGMHMTGPLRAAVKKAPGHERLLVACAFQLGASAEGSAGTPLPGAAALAAANLLRPLPYLLYLADGDSGDSYNVFTAQKMAPLQKVFKKHQMVDCSPPAALSTELGLPAGHPVHLGTVLTRCPHYLPSMRTKWGMPKGAADDEACCVLA